MLALEIAKQIVDEFTESELNYSVNSIEEEKKILTKLKREGLLKNFRWMYYHPMDNKEATSKREIANSNNSNDKAKKKGTIIENLFGKGIGGSQSAVTDKKEDDTDKVDYSYPDLNNCFYQRLKSMETLYSIIGKKEEEKAKKEENDIR